MGLHDARDGGGPDGAVPDDGGGACVCAGSNLCCDGCQPRDSGPANCQTDAGLGVCAAGECVVYDGGA